MMRIQRREMKLFIIAAKQYVGITVFHMDTIYIIDYIFVIFGVYCLCKESHHLNMVQEFRMTAMINKEFWSILRIYQTIYTHIGPSYPIYENPNLLSVLIQYSIVNVWSDFTYMHSSIYKISKECLYVFI